MIFGDKPSCQFAWPYGCGISDTIGDGYLTGDGFGYSFSLVRDDDEADEDGNGHGDGLWSWQ